MDEAGIMDLYWAVEAGIDVYDEGRIDEVIVLTPTEEECASDNILFKYCIS